MTPTGVGTHPRFAEVETALKFTRTHGKPRVAAATLRREAQWGAPTVTLSHVLKLRPQGQPDTDVKTEPGKAAPGTDPRLPGQQGHRQRGREGRTSSRAASHTDAGSRRAGLRPGAGSTSCGPAGQFGFTPRAPWDCVTLQPLPSKGAANKTRSPAWAWDTDQPRGVAEGQGVHEGPRTSAEGR